jgi:hypothetical protein
MNELNQTRPFTSGSNLILGDNIRDYKKFLEIEKMNRDNGMPNSNFSNTNTTNMNNSRLPFNYTPMRRNGNENNIINNQSLPRPLSQNPFNNTSFYNNNNNNTLSFGSDVYKEIQTLKNLMSKTIQNQNEMQEKIIEYYKIINEQSEIIRLNNLKLNEHDNKLTEVLLSFNNYIQLNDKTNNLINDFQLKLDSCVKTNDYNDLKSIVYNFNKSNENKINEFSRNFSDMNLKLDEMSQQNDNYQKATLDKILKVQKDSMESRLQQQNELIRLDDQKESRFIAQFQQVKNLIGISDKNLKEESNLRQNMINDLRNEILQIFNRNDEKISKLEKNQLETEKNIIGLNKDYMSTFNDLIMKHNEKYNIELKAIRSLIEVGLTKVDTKMEKDYKTYEENLIAMKKNALEEKEKITEFETLYKEQISSIEKNFEKNKEIMQDYFNKFDLLSSTLDKYMKENMELIQTKEKEIIENLSKKINEDIEKTNNTIKIQNDTNTKKFSDTEEKIKDLNNHIATAAVNNVKGDINGNNEPNAILIREYVEKIVSENITPFKETLSNYEIVFNNSMNLKFDEMIQKNLTKDKENFNKLNEIINSKFKEIMNKIDEKIKEENSVIDGRIQEYIVESEKRVDGKYEDSLKKIKEDIENLTIKIGIGS